MDLGRGLTRALFVIPLVVLLLVPVGVLVARNADLSWHDDAAGPAAPTAAPEDLAAGSDAPEEPPARVCDSGPPEGPSRPPARAVVVRPSDRLDVLVTRRPAGTTFWLAPGVHHLGPGTYDQVVPEDGDVFIGGPGAVLDGRRTNRYAFGGSARGVTITDLTVQRFGQSIADNPDEGVVNHGSASGWRMSRLTVRDNAGAGVFLGTDNVLSDSCLADNGQYGFQVTDLDDGPERVRVVGNEVTGNNVADWEKRSPGCGCTGGAKFWDASHVTVLDNWIHDNDGIGLWADSNNTDFMVRGNYIAGNTNSGIAYELSYNADFVDNTFVRNALVKGPGIGFPQPALYISESGSDPRAGGDKGDRMLVSGNVFVDNYSGVVLWESADRFAGSPAYSSTGFTTLVNPSVATLEACSDPALIGKEPYVDDCRWKTQNVDVVGNVFRFDPSRITTDCRAENGCGFVGMFSQVGTVPEWSPYLGQVVEKNITFAQDNRWSDNTYVGPWHFMVKEMGHEVSWAEWRSAPYDLDGGSTLTR